MKYGIRSVTIEQIIPAKNAYVTIDYDPDDKDGDGKINSDIQAWAIITDEDGRTEIVGMIVDEEEGLSLVGQYTDGFVGFYEES